MVKTRGQAERTKNSYLFKKLEIVSLSDILDLYLFYKLTQEIVDQITIESHKFLINEHDFNEELLNHFGLVFKYNEDKTYISVFGQNLLSSLWVIDIFPPNPLELIGATEYNDGDFVYKFYTGKKNLSIKKVRRVNERKLRSNK